MASLVCPQGLLGDLAEAPGAGRGDAPFQPESDQWPNKATKVPNEALKGLKQVLQGGSSLHSLGPLISHQRPWP